jgi:hypothetical protein
MTIEVEVNRDNVIIEGTRVPRPATASVSEWMEYWERFLNGMEDERCRASSSST